MSSTSNVTGRNVKLFLCGDVMTGRGIDQVMANPSNPKLYESYVKSAADYVTLAEEANGLISRPVAADYIWGNAVDEFERQNPDVKIINLETSVTTSDTPWPNKGINYRMHPQNVDCLTSVGIDVCSLANNHTLDWGRPGLSQTLATLQGAGIDIAGAGDTDADAALAAILEIDNETRVLVFAWATRSAGVPDEWAASTNRNGINLLNDLSAGSVRRIGREVKRVKRPGDIVVLSIHWGGNWGYKVPSSHQSFAHQLIDDAGVDVIHGHSSHHVKGIEIYRGKPILYGCGDFLNDYEGISGHEEFRGDLALMYFLTVNSGSGELVKFELTPMQIRNFRVNRADTHDRQWLLSTMQRESRPFGVNSFQTNENGNLILEW